MVEVEPVNITRDTFFRQLLHLLKNKPQRAGNWGPQESTCGMKDTYISYRSMAVYF